MVAIDNVTGGSGSLDLGSGLVWRSPGKPRFPATPAFLPLMRMAVETHSDDLDLLLDLTIALRDARQWCEIIDRLAPIATSGGLPPELAVELGVAANRHGDAEYARVALEMALDGRAVGRALRNPAGRAAARQRARVELSSIFTASGQHDAALGILTDALERDPRDEAVLGAVADAMLKRGEGFALIALLDDLEMCGVKSTLLLSARASALGATGAHGELERLVSPEQWCARVTIDREEIDNRRLAEVILAHPALSVSPGDRATHGGNHRLDALASRDDPELRAIVATIRQHVEAYIDSRRGQPHPLMAWMPPAAVLQGWALATEGDGHEARHFHPRGWITAVYYVLVPEGPVQRSGPPPGSIVFGPWPAEDYPCPRAFPAWHFEPHEGMLLIFPSFLAHSTIPCDTAEKRLCVTLDVMPRDLSA